MADVRIKTQKILKVGNSVALTIDPHFLSEAGVSVGDTVHIRYADDGSFMTILPEKKVSKDIQKRFKKAEKAAVLESKVTLEFREWVEKSLNEDEESLRKLANL